MGLSSGCSLWIIKSISFPISISNIKVIGIPDGNLIAGSFPSSQMKLVQAWIEIHKEELMADWKLAVEGQNVFKIEALK